MTIRHGTPICGAARPAPLRAAMVSRISASSSSNSGLSRFRTGSLTCNSCGSPIRNTRLRLMRLLHVVGDVGHARQDRIVLLLFLGRASPNINELLETRLGREKFRAHELRATARARHGHLDELLDFAWMGREHQNAIREINRLVQSEERHVGKECRSRWSPYH